MRFLLLISSLLAFSGCGTKTPLTIPVPPAKASPIGPVGQPTSPDPANATPNRP